MAKSKRLFGQTEVITQAQVMTALADPEREAVFLLVMTAVNNAMEAVKSNMLAANYDPDPENPPTLEIRFSSLGIPQERLTHEDVRKAMPRGPRS